MPKNRRHIPRAERSGDLVVAATELFLSRGYARTTMADISAAAGVARGNVYWYFASKDEIFAAVMDRMLGREMASLDGELAGTDAGTRLTRGVSDMRLYRPLHQAMHDRMPHSDAVRDAHERFLRWIRDGARAVARERGSSWDHDLVADLAVAVFEGANVPNERTRPAAEMLRVVLDALAPASVPAAVTTGRAR